MGIESSTSPSQGSPGRPKVARVYLSAVFLFLFLCVPILAWIHSDLRPAPVYPSHESHEQAPSVLVTESLPVELRISLSQPAERLLIPVMAGAARRPIRLEVEARGELLAETRVDETGVVRLPLGATGPDDRELTIRFSSDARNRESAPAVLWSAGAPRAGTAVRYGGRDLKEIDVLPTTGPLVLVEYAWPSRVLLGCWILPGVFGLLAWRDPKWSIWLLVTLALAASVTSTLLWQRDYSRRMAQLDADAYAQSATQLARYLGDAAARPEIAAWLRDYPHSSTLLAPALLAIPVALGVPVQLAYMQLSALAGLLSLLILFRLLDFELGFGERLAAVGTTLFACHLLMLRSFARPTTDILGLMLVLAMLGLLVRRLTSDHRRDEIALSVLLFLHPLARPQGFGYWLFAALAVLACDLLRIHGRRAWAPLVRSQLRIFAPPLLALALLYSVFGWAHNIELMLEKAERFRINSTLPIFMQSLVGVVQVIPLLWLRAGTALRRPDLLIWIAWLLFNLGLLVAVRAPYWMRHYLPILPVVFVLMVAGLARLRGRERLAAGGILGATIVFNLAITTHQIFDLRALPGAFAGFISSN
jgi:hypothetical protein